MRYEVTGEFVKISETTGTIQNMSNVYAVEVSNKAEADSGIILYPLNRISVTLSECYLRCVDGGNAEVRVVPFEVDVTRGGGSSAAGTSNLTDVFRSLEVIDGKANFYGTTDKSGDILASFNLPEEIFLNQVGTIVVHDFMFSALAYPNSTNPNLDGKTVLVLAVKGDKKTNPTIKYVFVDLQKLVDKYLASNKSININGYSIAVNISDDTKNLLALKEDGLFVGSDDSKLDKVPSAVQDNIPVFDVEGTIIDGGLSFADLEYELPTASVTTKGGVKVGSGLAITGDTLNVTISGGESYSDFTGATSIAGGLSGLVPAPAAGDEEKFLRGDGTWASVAGGSSSDGIVLPTVASAVDGGLWYEVTDNSPMIYLRQGNYAYGFNFDTLKYVGDLGDALVAYLPFDSTLADLGGNTWTTVGTLSIQDSALYVNGTGYLQNTTIADSIGAQPWTIDCWVNLKNSAGSVDNGVFAVETTGGKKLHLFLHKTGNLYYEGSIVSDTFYPVTFTGNTRYHVAATYDGANLRTFWNGTLLHTTPVDLTLTGEFDIGTGLKGYYKFPGAIDHFRIFRGVAMWTENFTPPTAADYV